MMVDVVLLPTTITLAIFGRSGTDFIQSLHVEINNGNTKVTYFSKTGEENKSVLLN